MKFCSRCGTQLEDNDFEEYLNYEGGFTSRFGNESVGNAADKVNKSNPPSNPKKILKA